ncbi:6,7-dimethyl-8-ribityllumazine synthase [bacterium SCSIO 12696]|nr:6,7-dimethyl-8-ribityllumazine synthase [bacterium SCSIO 12696]
MNQIQDIKIAFIQAGWHRDIVQQSYLAFADALKQNGLDPQQIDIVDVPGSLEIPLQAQLLAKTGKYHLIVAAGLVVDGGIYRHDFVAQAVLDGIMRVQLDCEVPILSVVLTPHHFQESEAHLKFFYDHFSIKGKEAAMAAIQTLQNAMALKDNQ